MIDATLATLWFTSLVVRFSLPGMALGCLLLMVLA